MTSFHRSHSWPKAVAIAVFIVVSGARGSTARCAEPATERPFALGVLADIQYADKDTHGRRHYRTALEKLEACVADLNHRNPAFVIQLGDIVDGYADDVDRSGKDLDSVLPVYNRLTMPKHHVVGNHCLRVGKEALRKKLGIERFYYDFTVPSATGWRFVVLDGNDAGYGVIGDQQLQWFRSTLDKAANYGERAVCFCHYALLRGAAEDHRMAKPEPVLKAIDDSGCVVAWFAGHDHAGGYAMRDGVHHVTIQGMVEAPVENAYAIVELHPNRMRVIGIGKEPSRDLPLAMPPRSVRASAVRTAR